MYILGGIDDQINLLVGSTISDGFFSIPSALLAYAPYKEAFSWLLFPLSSSRPVLEFFLSVFLSSVGQNGVLLANILITFVNLMASYLLFRKFKFGILLALVFSFSTFYWSHLGIHFSLLQLWMYPLFYFYMQKYLFGELSILKSSSILAGILALSIFSSNYLGMFLYIFYSTYTLFYIVYGFFAKKVILKKVIIKFLLSMFTSSILIVSVLWPYLKINYFQKTSASSYVSQYNVVRPLEDFVYFSSRPWYFVIPPTKNPLLGNIGLNILNKVENTGYFLADDYFAGEHAANYFGISFYLLFLVSLYFYLRAGDSFENRQRVFALLGTAGFLFLLSFPPYFTISGLKINSFGNLLYKFFPMFRSTARLSLPILFSLVTTLGIMITRIYKSTNVSPKFLKGFIVLILLITLLETYIPSKIQKLTVPSQSYVYLQNTPINSKFIVYPYSKSEETFFWLSVHKRLLINMPMYKNEKYDSQMLTKSLTSESGLKNIQNLDVNYLLVFKPIDATIFDFFNASPVLQLDKEFSDSYLFKVL